ncbi:hypothetical protein D3C72_2084620 [compost metagenome]
MLTGVQAHPPQGFSVFHQPVAGIDKGLHVAWHGQRAAMAVADVLGGGGLIVGHHAQA